MSGNREVWFDPQPDDKLSQLWNRDEVIADAIEEAIDLIRNNDIRAKRRAFSGGIYLIEVRARGEDWTILWEYDYDDAATIRYIGESTSI